MELTHADQARPFQFQIGASPSNFWKTRWHGSTRRPANTFSTKQNHSSPNPNLLCPTTVSTSLLSDTRNHHYAFLYFHPDSAPSHRLSPYRHLTSVNLSKNSILLLAVTPTLLNLIESQTRPLLRRIVESWPLNKSVNISLEY